MADLRPVLSESMSALPRRSVRRFAVIQTLLRDPVGRFGVLMVSVAVLAAIFGPVFAPFDPTAISPDERLASPGTRFPLGSDELGRDIFSRALHGARISMQVGLIVVTIAGLVGVTIGVISGYFKGLLDLVLMRLMDTVFAFPTLLLVLVIVAALGTDLQDLIVALTIVYIPAFARIARGSTLALGEELYVEAARSVGVSHRRIMFRHVLPNITGPIMVQFTVSLAYAILVEASLSYLGLGVQPPAASWGSMLASGKPFMESSPWLSVVPGVAIMVTVLGFNLLGDAMRDALDPRLRSRG